MNGSVKLSRQYNTRIDTDKVFMCDAERKYKGIADDNIRFIERVQLKDRELWKKLVSFFGTDIDDEDNGWRCEYWGKIMRGASWVYAYTRDNELYDILTDAVRGLLARQDEKGRLSTYSVEKEFNGWDMWGRKYVMLGLLHYYDICRDSGLKEMIVDALKRHADYIVGSIGESGRDILDTSDIWGAVNSSSILEPMVRLYNLTGEDRYIEFAGYIVESGLTKDFDLIDAAYKDEMFPFEYPVKKAYEVMSCFEGLMEYWRVTREERYFEAARRFADRVMETEISIIGCAGCHGEVFNHGSLEQSNDEYTDIMQETCVTVTWMKLCAQLFCATGDIKYIEELEKSAYNAMQGSVNTGLVRTESLLPFESGLYPFDSYSPLILGRRGARVGGYKSDGEFYYGCCAAIGSAGLGLIPLTAFMRTKKGFSCNMYIDGTVKTDFNGAEVKAGFYNDIVEGGKLKVTIDCSEPREFELKLRIPYYAKDAKVRINGEERTAAEESFFTVDKIFEKDEIEIMFTPHLEVIEPMSKEHRRIAFKYGPYVLARDLRFCGDTGEGIAFENAKDLNAVALESDSMDYRLRIRIKENDRVITEMIDYASAGKTLNEKSLMEAWLAVPKKDKEVLNSEKE